MRARFALFAIIAALSASPLSAQDGSETLVQRTPEGAQKFLTDFFADGGGTAEVALDVHDDRTFVPLEAGRVIEGTAANFDAPEVQWSAVDRCHSHIQVKGVRLKYTDGSSVPLAPLQYDVDWSKVLKSASGGPYGISILRTSGLILPRFHIKTADGVERVVFALEFLRTQCGFKSDTGF